MLYLKMHVIKMKVLSLKRDGRERELLVQEKVHPKEDPTQNCENPTKENETARKQKKSNFSFCVCFYEKII